MIGKEISPQDQQFNPVRTPVDPCRTSYQAMGSLSQFQCRDRLRRGGVGPALAVIPGRKRLESFAITANEISVQDFNRFCQQNDFCKQNPADEDLPIVSITFSDALEYAKWLSGESGYRYRIPRLPEWRHAVVANGVDLLPDFNCEIHRGNRRIRGGSLRSVYSGQQNAWGLRNFYGNAAEWVLDGLIPVVAGGGFNTPIKLCNAALVQPHAGMAEPTIGFRLVRELR